MKIRNALSVWAFLSSLFMVGCSQSGDHADLRRFIDAEKARPAGRIDPIPTYPPYENFIYSAVSKRSPFDKPIDIQRRVYVQGDSAVKPDFTRTKEHLEGFDVGSLVMVGTLKRGEMLWALLRDANGEIHRVSKGNYVGNNHGKIMSVENTKIELVEIVSDGLDGWVERPRLLALAEKDK